MKRIVSIIVFALIIFQISPKIHAQGWVSIPNTPINPYRHDDVSFCTVDSGIITNQTGEVYLTHDGGQSWDTIFSSQNVHGRSIGMLSASTYIMGQYGHVQGSTLIIDTNAVFISFNSGQNWSPVTNYSGPKPAGICGISVVNELIAMGVGRWDGTSTFIKTLDGGLTFSSKDMSMYSSGLVDCHFFNADSGIAVGRSPNATPTNSVATVLFTSDGGQNWQTIYSGTETSRWCWKITFPSRQIGYISVENNYTLSSLDTNYVLKSMDGGLTWQPLPVYVGGNRLQGIGFVNDTLGWTGEHFVYKTTNGGLSWNLTNELSYLNRMRKVNDSVFVAVGSHFNKYDFTTTSMNEISNDTSFISNLIGSPNPVNNIINVQYQLNKTSPISTQLFNQAGLLIYRKEIPNESPGKKSFDLNMLPYHSGIYFLVLSSNIGYKHLTIIKE